MQAVGSYEAKTHLSRLLAEVEHGEEFVITRHGRAIARLVPIVESSDPARTRELLAKLRRFRAGRTLEGITIRELIEEGRR